MKTILFLVGIVITLGAAYVSLNNTKKFAKIGEETEALVAKKKTIELNAEKEAKKLKSLDTELAAVNEAISDEEVKLDKVRKTTKQLARELEGHQDELASLDAKLERVEDLKQEISEALDGIGVDDISEIPAVVEQINKQIDSKQTELDSVNSINEKLTEKVEQDASAIQKSRQDLATIRKRIANNGKEMRIQAINSEWDFAVIGAGSKDSNLAPNAELLVIRNQELVGRLFTKTVEANQTICDVDTDFRVNLIEVGDQVILRNPVAK